MSLLELVTVTQMFEANAQKAGESHSVGVTDPYEGTALTEYDESSEEVFGDLRWEMDMNTLRSHVQKSHFEK